VHIPFGVVVDLDFVENGPERVNRGGIGDVISNISALADALQATFERDPDLYYEDGFQEYANRGGEVRFAPIGDVDWVEVDNHDDLTKARGIACRY
jgi:hypothetical protein